MLDDLRELCISRLCIQYGDRGVYGDVPCVYRVTLGREEFWIWRHHGPAVSRGISAC